MLVLISYRLKPGDFVYIVNHSGATVACADRDYLDAVDGVRDRMPEVAAGHPAAVRGTPGASRLAGAR